ncbi:MAG: hypothetical protein H7332_05440 [Bdellovibrionales bacterium]|nr:hypothetical protein [Ramlibacter sp.]
MINGIRPCTVIPHSPLCRLVPLGGGAYQMSSRLSPPRWSTSCFGDDARPTLLETTSLVEHVTACNDHGRLFTLQCCALTAHGFAVSRFVTVLAIASILMGICVLVL